MPRTAPNAFPTPESIRARSRLLGLALVLLGGGACADGARTTGNLLPAEGIVYGEIRDTAGRLQGGATFEVVVYARDCDRPNPVLQGVPAVTPDGRYRLLLRGPHFFELAACLVVNAQADAASGVLRGTVRDRMLILRGATAGAPDSLAVDMVVR